GGGWGGGPGGGRHGGGPAGDRGGLLARCAVPHDGQVSTVHHAIRAGATVTEVAAASGIDPWFIDQVASLEDHAERLADGWPAAPETLRAAKRAGFSDAQIAEITGTGEDEVRRRRHELGVRPGFCAGGARAGEFRARTPCPDSACEAARE